MFGRRSGAHAAARGAPDADAVDAASRVAETEKHITAIMNRPQGGRRIGAIKNELGETMNEYVAVFRDEAGLTKAHEIVRRLKEEATVAAIDDRGSVFNQDVIARDRARVHARRGRDDRRRRARAQGIAAGRSGGLDYPGRHDDEWLKHIDISMNGADVPW